MKCVRRRKCGHSCIAVCIGARNFIAIVNFSFENITVPMLTHFNIQTKKQRYDKIPSVHSGFKDSKMMRQFQSNFQVKLPKTSLKLRTKTFPRSLHKSFILPLGTIFSRSKIRSSFFSWWSLSTGESVLRFLGNFGCSSIFNPSFYNVVSESWRIFQMEFNKHILFNMFELKLFMVSLCY